MRAAYSINCANEVESGKFSSQEINFFDLEISCPIHKGIQFKLLENLYIENKVLFTSSRSIKLSVAATKIIYKLKLANGEPVSKEELLIFAWGSDKKVLNNVNVAISELRRALSDTPAEIVTIRNAGYSLYIPIKHRK